MTPPLTLVVGDAAGTLRRLCAIHRPRLIFADPPYNQGIDYGNGEKEDSLPYEGYELWLREWIYHDTGALTEDGSLWILVPDEWAAEYVLACKGMGLTMRSWVKWYETFGVNCTRKFNRTSRHLLHFVRNPRDFVFNRSAVSRPSDRQVKYDDPRANPEGKILDDVWLDVPRLAGTHKERIKGFPTQLPVALLERIVLCASDPGDLVCDPFNGSGTTGAAALRHARRYLGIDKSATFIEMARARLEKEHVPDVRQG